MESVVRKSVAFEPSDLEAVKKVAKENGLGRRGFSAAVRMIIRRYVENEAAFDDCSEGLKRINVHSDL